MAAHRGRTLPRGQASSQGNSRAAALTIAHLLLNVYEITLRLAKALWLG
jgi:hypothetical protein